MTHQVLHGDCLDVLKTLPDNSVDSVVTDPPAGIGFMGKEWDKDKGGRAHWVAWMTDIAAECLRVIKPGGHALVWAIPRTSHWTAMAWEDAGWEPRDKLYHAFATGFPKSHNLDGDWSGWGTALKPAVEEWWLFRKPLSESTVAKNVLRWGTGALNIDGCRVGTDVVTTHGGRWPAQLLHDGSDEVVGMFPESKSGIAVRRNGGGQKIFNKTNNAGARPDAGYTDCGSAARFFYCAKASRRERDAGLDDMPELRVGAIEARNRESGKGQFEGPTPMGRNTHATVKPVALMRYLCRLITPPGGIVLDPFGGSGTTGVGAVHEGFDCILIEREPDYVEIARRRLAHAAGALFAEEADHGGER